MAKRQPAKAPSNHYLTAGSPDDLGPSNRIAYDLLRERRDLLPSLERIMNAEVDDEHRLRAISLFQASLLDLADPHRDPRVAIANSAPPS